MILVFIHGAAAAAKSTVAKELAQRTAFRLFHNYLTVDLVSSLFDFGTPPFIRLREQIWLAAFEECARNDVSLIFTFNPERTVSNEFIQNTSELVQRNGGRILFVELTCAGDELERRLEQPSRKEFGKLASLEQYRLLKEAGAFDYPKPPADISIDTTLQSALECARMIEEYIAGQAD